MCGRFIQVTRAEQLAAQFGAGHVDASIAGIPPRYNLAPSQDAIVVVAEREGTNLVTARWGFPLPGQREKPARADAINARIETAAERPLFRDALRLRRCLIPCDGFYEWQAIDANERANIVAPSPGSDSAYQPTLFELPSTTRPGSVPPPGRSRSRAKRPWFIRMRNGEPFGLAGLWSPTPPVGSSHDPEAAASNAVPTRRSFVILTTGPNELMATIHHRMPVIVPPDRWHHWLTLPLGAESAADFASPYPATAMQAWVVSPAVNDPRIENASLANPVGSLSLHS